MGSRVIFQMFFLFFFKSECKRKGGGGSAARLAIFALELLKLVMDLC